MTCTHRLVRADGVEWLCELPAGHDGHHRLDRLSWPSGVRSTMRVPQHPDDLRGALVAIEDVPR